jgi:hypothetical protein
LILISGSYSLIELNIVDGSESTSGHSLFIF